MEQQTDEGIFNTHLQKTGFANVEVQKTEDSIQIYGQKPNPHGSKKKLSTQLRKGASKMELTLNTPTTKQYRVKASLDMSTTLTPCSMASSPLKQGKSGLTLPTTPAQLYADSPAQGNSQDTDVIQRPAPKRQLSNSIIQQLNQANHPSTEMKKHIQAADADLVRIKTERQLAKPAEMMQQPLEDLPDTNMKNNPLSSEFHQKVQSVSNDKDTESKE